MTKMYKKIFMALTTAACVLTACTETWDDYYNAKSAHEGTLWTALSQQGDVSNFASVLKACGYDARLSSSQVFTVFAPTNASFSAQEASDLISRYQQQKADGVKDEDNEVVKQFVQNHIALYNLSVSSLTADSIKLMNGKYMQLTSDRFGKSSVVSKNQLYANGVLFTIDQPEQYDPNVFEYLRADGELDSLANFLYGYDLYEFDASSSVAGGEVKNGKVVYLDSVFRLNNAMLSQYGYLNREDSNYLVVSPTDTEWQRLYNEYASYYNYADNTARRDSMIRTMTRRAIFDGTVFNLNLQESLQDSALSTTYQRLYRNTATYEEPRYYRFYQPFAAGGAFSGGRSVTCSNGQVMKLDHWNIDPTETFMQEIKVEGESNRYIDTVLFAREPVGLRQVPVSNPFYGKVSANYFVEAQPIAASSTTTLRYTLPNFLSNVGYDIYCVCAPAIAYNERALPEDTLPCRLNFRIAFTNQDGTLASETALRNPANNTANYITRPNVVDTVLVASNYKFPTCAQGLNLQRAMATLRVASSYISNRESSLYTRTLRIDCILLRPHRE